MAVLLGNNAKLPPTVEEGFADLSGPSASYAQILLPDNRAGMEAALDHLRQAQDSSLIRITGAGILSPQDAKALDSLFARAFSGQFSGMVLTGATRATELDSAVAHRGVMEAGAKLEATCPGARVLGVVPSQRLEMHYDGTCSVVREEGLEVGLHPDNKLILSTAEKTPYLWDAEWQRCLGLKHALNPSSSVLISFDGGIATDREIRAWAAESKRDPHTHVVLLGRSAPDRATAQLSRNFGFLREHPNVHVVEFDAGRLNQIARDLEILPTLQRSLRIAG